VGALNAPQTDVRTSTALVVDEGESEVADLSLAQAGRRAIGLAEHEMPGLMAVRAEYGALQPLAGARISGFLHMTVQTAVLIETLTALGAEVRWAGSNQFSTQDEAAAAVAVGRDGSRGVPVFAWKGQHRRELWQCARKALTWPGGESPNMLLDDGAGLTLFVHHGAATEAGRAIEAEELRIDAEAADEIRLGLHRDPAFWTRLVATVAGVSEETTSGSRILRMLEGSGRLRFPAITVNESVTKSKFDNRYGCRHSLIDGLNRATDTLLGGKRAVVCGYGDVGKGCAEALRGQGARVTVTEIDPICALQAAMDGYDVTTLEHVVEEADVFITATGVGRVITAEHMARMKHQAIVGNMGMGQRDTEIDLAALASSGQAVRRPVKPQVDEWVFADGKSIIVLSEGGPLNLGNATGHPSFIMSSSFVNQALAQIELYGRGPADPVVAVIPKPLDEKVARLHLAALGARLTILTDDQSANHGIPAAGPYKHESYRY
jgi:adenosylhomocysteinase